METIRRTGRILENTWECGCCGKKNRGRDRECAGCGRPKSKDIEYNHEHIAVLEGEEAEKHRRPDWFCECCDSFNPDSETSCVSCGAPRGASKDYFQIKKEQEHQFTDKDASYIEEYPLAESMQGMRLRQDTKTTEEAHAGDLKPPAAPKLPASWMDSFFEKLIIGVVGAVAIAVLALFLSWFLKPEVKTGTVTDLTWKTSVSLEELTTIRDEDWNLPAGARAVDSYKRYKETTQVVDHYKTVTEEVTKYRTVQDEDLVWYTYEDLGNGFDEEVEHRVPQYHEEPYIDYEDVKIPVYKDVDVYETWYIYEYDKWKTIDTKQTQGRKGEEHDPELVPNGDRQRVTPYERSFYVQIDVGDEFITMDISKGIYDLLEPGDSVTLEVYKAGIVIITEVNEKPID